MSRPAVLGVLVLALALAGCSRQQAATPGPLWFPARLQGLAIVDSIAGDAARATLRKMHGRGVAPANTRIGVYGREALPTVLYISRYASADTAASEMRSMVTTIGTGRSGFVARRSFRAAGLDVFEVAGHGQAHYYFVRGAELAWLSAPPDRGAAVLAELLRVDLRAIPR